MEYSNLESLSSDILRNMAMDMDLKSIKNLCLTSKKFNGAICANRNFWVNKLLKDYGFVYSEGIPKDIYSEIYKNKNYCGYLNLRVGKIADDDVLYVDEDGEKMENLPFVEAIPEYIMNMTDYNSNDILVFNYITGKIFKADKRIPNYFERTFDRYIGKLQPLYEFKIERGPVFSLDESRLLMVILNHFRNFFSNSYERNPNRKDAFLKAFTRSLVTEKIPLDVTLKELCKYNLY